MSKKHLVFIVNPRSGMERQKQIQAAIDGCLNLSVYTYEILHTLHAKHGTALAMQAAAGGAFAVVAVGGDGSVNDVVAGLVGSETALAIIPKGSGNGMARTMGIPLEVAGAIKLINAGKIDEIDVGWADGRPFISNAGVGFDALISNKFAKSKTRGLPVYSWLVTKYLWFYNEWHWRIIIDGVEIKDRAFLVNVANGRQFGYNFKIAPHADWKDGLLDIIVIRRFPKMLASTLLVRALAGTITGSPYVKHYKGREITVIHPDLRMMQTDGDAHPCGNRVHFTVKNKWVKVIVP